MTIANGSVTQNLLPHGINEQNEDTISAIGIGTVAATETMTMNLAGVLGTGVLPVVLALGSYTVAAVGARVFSGVTTYSYAYTEATGVLVITLASGASTITNPVAIIKRIQQVVASPAS